MAQQHDDTRAHARREDYRDARAAFDDLRFEDQALFLVEAAVSTVVRGVEQLSRAFARGLDDVMHEAEQARHRGPDDGDDETEASSEPSPTSKKQTKKAPAKSAPKKSPTKKSTTKKSPKRSPKKKPTDDEGDAAA